MADEPSRTGERADEPGAAPRETVRPKSPEAFGRSAPPRQNGSPRGDSARAVVDRREQRPDGAPDRSDADSKAGEDDGAPARADDQRDPGKRPAQKPRKPFYKRPVPLAIIAIVLIGAIVAGLLWWLHARHYAETDDAIVQGNITRVAPQVSGRVERVLVEDNQEVHVGDLLAEIRPIDYEVRLQQTQSAQTESEAKLAQARAQESVTAANAEQAKAEVSAAEATEAQASADLKRYESLSAEAVSKQQLDQVRATAKNTAAQLEAARRKLAAAEAQSKAAATETQAASAAVVSAEAQVKQAQVQLGYTKIKATVDGWVTSKSIAVGDYVQPGQQLLAIVPRDVWVIANYKETQLDDIRPGQQVNIEVDAYPDRTFHGTVQSIQSGSGAAFSLLPPENATGNYVKVVQRVPVKITFNQDTPPNPPNSTQRVGPGMSVVPKVKIR